MPFPAVLDQMAYWAKHPPVHLMLADFLGVKPAEQSREEAAAAAQPAADFASLPRYARDFLLEHAAHG